MNNPWDRLSQTFNTKKDEEAISPDAADNILIAWPVILDFIAKHKPQEQSVHVLDFGCGAGGFADKLHSRGFDVSGIDSSEAMIKLAKESYGTDISFFVGESSALNAQKQYDIITSVMVLQFIENIEKTIDDFSHTILQGGLLVFAVHNPEHIKDYLKAKELFEDVDSFEDPRNGFINLGGNKIPIFLRSAEEYNKILENKGFQSILESYPPFTEEFLKKYPVTIPVNNPRFLILGYKKR